MAQLVFIQTQVSELSESLEQVFGQLVEFILSEEEMCEAMQALKCRSIQRVELVVLQA